MALIKGLADLADFGDVVVDTQASKATTPTPAKPPNVTVRATFADGKTADMAQIYLNPATMVLEIKGQKLMMDKAYKGDPTAPGDAKNMVAVMSPGDEVQWIFNNAVYDKWVYPAPAAIAPAKPAFALGMNAPTFTIIGVVALIAIAGAAMYMRGK